MRRRRRVGGSNEDDLSEGEEDVLGGGDAAGKKRCTRKLYKLHLKVFVIVLFCFLCCSLPSSCVGNTSLHKTDGFT